MSERLTAAGPMLGGTSDRREFLTSVAALTAGVLASPSDAVARQATPRKQGRIDFHHHYQSPGWTDYAASFGLRVSQFDREPVTRSPWTLAKAIEALDKTNIDLAYTSAATYYTKTSQLIKNGAWGVRSGDTVRRLARDTNDYGAKVVADSKGRFRLLPVLPLPDVDASVREIDYALTTLKAPGLCLPTSVGILYLGDPKFAPVLEELNRRGAVVHTHPAEPDWSIDLVPGVNAAQVWYGNDTTVAILSMLRNDVPKKYPNIRWIFSHGGGTMPYLIERIVNEPVAPKLNGTPKPGEPLHSIRNFYYDTAQVANTPCMLALKKVVGVSQILFGTDYPWSTMQDHVEGMIDSEVFTPDELAAIDRGNALRLLPL